ncbi:probable UMP-CMP kinase 2 isoform X2 [Impatiens glandulifera]|uniref:probable UMP-CMP kinase 2 isoform X2 n=1 Tax=Impatiens glandulifera TaxID=253017 RepID=UPI001FB14336|nr:probable UMP-CMP kinase 2 isoform X2 [Impatiens glandulifera]XP_047325014.1 probable UMP-CMP kinase 2 isoform X2 [Impatiens glandulifera]
MWRRTIRLSSILASSRPSLIIQTETAYRLKISERFCSEVNGGSPARDKTPFITFVLGGPGSGKGTQCARLAEMFGFTHLSAGDLLREEISLNTENGSMILNTIKEGKIVPTEVTVKLIQEAINSSANDKFLIDGFPRTEENRLKYEQIVGGEPNMVLFFDCPKDEMVKRLLSRNQGRIDDNIETIGKRMEVFRAVTLPVINYYSNKGKLYKIMAVGTEDEVFERVKPIFTGLKQSLEA